MNMFILYGRKFRRLRVVLLLAALSFSFTPIERQYPGTNLRGRIITYNMYRQEVPAVSMRVDLLIFNYNINQWVSVAYTFTDGYGFYFFRGVAPNNYLIQLAQNGNRTYNVQVVMIDYRFYSYQDLPIFTF